MSVSKNAKGQAEPLEGGKGGLPLCLAPKHDSQIYIYSMNKAVALYPGGFCKAGGG